MIPTLNYIAHLKSLSEQELKETIESKIHESEKVLLNDKARINLLDDDDLYAWSDIDNLDLDTIRFDEAANECVVEIAWQSWASGNEDDERIMHGNATVQISDGGHIEFTEITAMLEGIPPKHGNDFDEPLGEEE